MSATEFPFSWWILSIFVMPNRFSKVRMVSTMNALHSKSTVSATTSKSDYLNGILTPSTGYLTLDSRLFGPRLRHAVPLVFAGLR